jgi:hypothetical protein
LLTSFGHKKPKTFYHHTTEIQLNNMSFSAQNKIGQGNQMDLSDAMEQLYSGSTVQEGTNQLILTTLAPWTAKAPPVPNYDVSPSQSQTTPFYESVMASSPDADDEDVGGLFLFLPRDRSNSRVLTHWKYDKTLLKYVVHEVIAPSLTLDDYFSWFQQVSSGLRIESGTTSGTVFNVQGQLVGITFSRVPDLAPLKFSTLISFANNSQGGFAMVPIQKGMVLIPPPQGEYPFQSLDPDAYLIPSEEKVYRSVPYDFKNGGFPALYPLKPGWLGGNPVVLPGAVETIIFDSDAIPVADRSKIIPINCFGQFRIRAQVGWQSNAPPAAVENFTFRLNATVRNSAGTETLTWAEAAQSIPNLAPGYTPIMEMTSKGIDFASSNILEHGVLERVTLTMFAPVGIDGFFGQASFVEVVPNDVAGFDQQGPGAIMAYDGVFPGQQIVVSGVNNFNAIPDSQLSRVAAADYRPRGLPSDLNALFSLYGVLDHFGLRTAYPADLYDALMERGLFESLSNRVTLVQAMSGMASTGLSLQTPQPNRSWQGESGKSLGLTALLPFAAPLMEMAPSLLSGVGNIFSGLFGGSKKQQPAQQQQRGAQPDIAGMLQQLLGQLQSGKSMQTPAMGKAFAPNIQYFDSMSYDDWANPGFSGDRDLFSKFQQFLASQKPEEDSTSSDSESGEKPDVDPHELAVDAAPDTATKNFNTINGVNSVMKYQKVFWGAKTVVIVADPDRFKVHSITKTPTGICLVVQHKSGKPPVSFSFNHGKPHHEGCIVQMRPLASVLNLKVTVRTTEDDAVDHLVIYPDLRGSTAIASGLPAVHQNFERGCSTGPTPDAEPGQSMEREPTPATGPPTFFQDGRRTNPSWKFPSPADVNNVLGRFESLKKGVVALSQLLQLNDKLIDDYKNQMINRDFLFKTAVETCGAFFPWVKPASRAKGLHAIVFSTQPVPDYGYTPAPLGGRVVHVDMDMEPTAVASAVETYLSAAPQVARSIKDIFVTLVSDTNNEGTSCQLAVIAALSSQASPLYAYTGEVDGLSIGAIGGIDAKMAAAYQNQKFLVFPSGNTQEAGKVLEALAAAQARTKAIAVREMVRPISSWIELSNVAPMTGGSAVSIVSGKTGVKEQLAELSRQTTGMKGKVSPQIKDQQKELTNRKWAIELTNWIRGYAQLVAQYLGAVAKAGHVKDEYQARIDSLKRKGDIAGMKQAMAAGRAAMENMTIPVIPNELQFLKEKGAKAKLMSYAKLRADRQSTEYLTQLQKAVAAEPELYAAFWLYYDSILEETDEATAEEADKYLDEMLATGAGYKKADLDELTVYQLMQEMKDWLFPKGAPSDDAVLDKLTSVFPKSFKLPDVQFAVEKERAPALDLAPIFRGKFQRPKRGQREEGTAPVQNPEPEPEMRVPRPGANRPRPAQERMEPVSPQEPEATAEFGPSDWF